MVSGRKIVFLLFGGMKMLDVTGPAEVFAEANLVGADYLISYVSASGEPVMTSAGLGCRSTARLRTWWAPTPWWSPGEMCWFSAGAS